MTPLAGRAAFFALLVGLGGCTRSDAPLASGPREAPAIVLDSPSGPFRLASHRGQAVLLQFAPGDATEAWAALAEARADLEAGGAVVIGVSTSGEAPPSAYAVGRDEGTRAANAFGYEGVPLAVLIDPTGHIRGQVTPRGADDLFELAAPVLLETSFEMEDGPSTVVVDLRDDRQREADGPIPDALLVGPAGLSAESLPADLATTVVFVGPGSEAAVVQALDWGYVNAHALDSAPVRADDAASEPLPRPARRLAPRVRL